MIKLKEFVKTVFMCMVFRQIASNFQFSTLFYIYLRGTNVSHPPIFLKPFNATFHCDT